MVERLSSDVGVLGIVVYDLLEGLDGLLFFHLVHSGSPALYRQISMERKQTDDKKMSEPAFFSRYKACREG